MPVVYSARGGHPRHVHAMPTLRPFFPFFPFYSGFFRTGMFPLRNGCNNGKKTVNKRVMQDYYDVQDVKGVSPLKSGQGGVWVQGNGRFSRCWIESCYQCKGHNNNSGYCERQVVNVLAQA